MINFISRFFNFGRASRWPYIRSIHLKDHNSCAVCGCFEKLEVHHIIPYSLDKSKELDPTNLITLCEKHSCHLMFGHLGNYKSYNADVVKDSNAMLSKIKERPMNELKIDKVDKPVINNVLEATHVFIEKKIVDIPGLTDEQKKAIRQYSLDLAAVVAEALVKGALG